MAERRARAAWRRRIVPGALALAAIVGAYLLLRRAGVDPFAPGGLEALAAAGGRWAPLAFVGLIALAVVVSQLPGVPLTIAAGALWGPGPATLYAVTGSFLGGMIAYGIGRSLGRGAMLAMTGRVVVFEERGARRVGWALMISRALPIVSFDVVSYAAGVSGLNVRVYAVATLVGMIPSTALLATLGDRFVVDPWIALAVSAVAAAGLLVVPRLARRGGWLEGIVRLEEVGAVDRVEAPDASSR